MLFPVAARELLAASRRPSTWGIRLGLTVLATLTCWLMLILPGAPLTSQGQSAFLAITTISFLYALFAGIFFTADCISEERREGTLGLLYLSRLTSLDLVAGKLASSSLQSVYALVAVVPALFLPLLAGGVTITDLIRTCVMLLLTLILSLAAGMFASAIARSARQAVLLTVLLLAAPTLGGCLGVLCVAPFVFAFLATGELPRQPKRADGANGGKGAKSANAGFGPYLQYAAGAGWLGAYLVLAAVWMTTIAILGHPLAGSPIYTWSAAANSAAAAPSFPSAAVMLAAIAAFYLCSANLSTEWHLGAKRLVDENHPGVPQPTRSRTVKRAHPRIGDDPVDWLLRRERSFPATIYLALPLLLLVSLAIPIGPGRMLGGGLTFYSFAFGPYALFNLGLALQCAAPFSQLRRSGLLETLLTTPVRLTDLLMAQKQIYWQTLRIPVTAMLLVSALLGPYQYFLQGDRILAAGAEYLAGFALSWILFFVHLNALFWVAIAFGLDGHKPVGAAGRTLLMAFLAPTGLTFFIPAAGWSVMFLLGYNSTFYLAWHLLGQVLALGLYLFLIRWAKARMGLREPPRIWRRLQPIVPEFSSVHTEAV